MKTLLSQKCKLLIVLALAVSLFAALTVAANADTGAAYSSTTDQSYETLQAAIDATAEGGTVTLLSDITISEVGGVESSTGAKNFGAIINKSMTLDGAGYTIIGANSSFRAVVATKGGDATATVIDNQIEVTIKNVTIDAGQCNMAFEDRGNLASLTVEDSNFYAGRKVAYTQPFTIGGIEDEINVTIDNCKIWTDEAASKYYAIMIWSPVNMTITDSDIRGWACLYFKDGSAGANVTITDSSLKSVGISGSSNHFAMITMEDDNITVTITDSTVDVTAAANTYQSIMAASASYEDVSVDFTGDNEVSFTGDHAAAVLNAQDGSISFEDTTAFTFEDADLAIEDVNYYLPNDKKLDVDAEGNATVTDVVAFVGDVKYASLQEAFAAAQDGDTITLYDNCNGDGIIVPQGKFQPAGLTVDFNGYTFDMDGTTVGSTGTETLAFQLLKDNNLTFKNGTITSSTPSCKMILQNYSNLTLINMNIDGTYPTVLYAVSNNNGETLIKDSTITANETGVAFDVWYGMSTAYPSVAVTVEGSTINGDVEYGAHKNANMANVETNMGLTITDSEIHGDIKNSSAAVNKDAVEAAAEETLVIEDTVVDGQNVFSVAKTLLVYNMDMVDGQYQIALFAGVDALEYQTAGFEVTQNGETTVYTTRWVSTGVSVNGIVKEAAEFQGGAQYVFGQIINLDSDAAVSIRAFVTDYAGNTTYNKTIGVPDIYTLNN